MNVDLKKISQTPGGLQPDFGIARKGPTPTGVPDFSETLEKLGREGTGISDNRNLTPANAEGGVKFSNHAVERMMSRGIKFSPEDVGRLNEAVGRAAAKGSKDTLVLMNDSALIVSVKNKTVVTVMDKTALKENVFTNIDSTIVM